MINKPNFSKYAEELWNMDALGVNTKGREDISRYHELLFDLVDIDEEHGKELLPWKLSTNHLEEKL